MSFTDSIHLLFVSLVLVAPIACTGSSSTQVDCKTASVPKFADMKAWDKCTSCHATTLTGASRAGAPSDINYDNYDDAVADADRAQSEVEAGAMPPGGGLTSAERDQIVVWASCDTPQ